MSFAIGDRVRHFKGGIYRVIATCVSKTHHTDFTQIAYNNAKFIGIARDADAPDVLYPVLRMPSGSIYLLGPTRTQEYSSIFVIYESEADGRWWFRTAANFEEQVPTGPMVPRFERIGEKL